MPEARVAIIGGSGFYQMDGLTDVEEARVSTPFGQPSDTIVVGTLDGVRVAFLPRHGRGHRLLPSEVPAQANIYALKTLGVEFIIAVSAVGSLRQEIEPCHLAVPEQLIDRTKDRPNTFFGQGLAAHIAFAEPFCPVLRDNLLRSATEAGAVIHNGGALVVMEGPAFSTKAESDLYRSWGADLIVMTTLPEAKLAREAEVCYAVLACVTDYDCWYEGQESVTAEIIVSNLAKTVEVAQRTVRLALARLPARRDCLCASALQDALVTPLDIVPQETKQNLAPIIGRYLAAKPRGS
jgi:5'-methylthioadenosine phosphorylase